MPRMAKPPVEVTLQWTRDRSTARLMAASGTGPETTYSIVKPVK